MLCTPSACVPARSASDVMSESPRGAALYIPVKFNGHGPHWMMLDTGAPCLLDRRFAERIGVRAEGQQVLHGNGSQAANLSHAKLETIAIGGVTLHEQRCEMIDLQRFEEFEGVQQFGLVGYEVYRRLVVRQDHAAGRIAFIDRSHFKPPGQARSVSFEFHDIRPMVAGNVDGIDGRFFVDTGSRNSASAYSWFADRHALRERYPNHVEVVAGFGVGGAVRSHVTRAREVRLGDVPFKAPLFDFPIGNAGAMSSEDAAVVVGTGMLRDYGVVTFDYERRRIFFEQPSFEQPSLNTRSDMDRSGLQMKVAARGFLVLDVLTDSPAARAGLQVDDVLVAVDNRAISRWTVPELREYLRISPVGKSIAVEAVRKEQKRSFNLILDDLL
jgi:PDZ domain/Aspartyl protease